MTTAFQPSAFQNNAFQIDFLDKGAGSGTHGSGKKRRFKTETPQEYFELIEQYKSLKEIPESIEKKIISAVNPFVSPETPEEIERYSKAQFISESILPSERVDFDMLLQNSISLERLRSALAEMRKVQEEEFLVLLMLTN